MRWDDRVVLWAFTRPWWLRVLMFPISGPLLVIWFYWPASKEVKEAMDELGYDE